MKIAVISITKNGSALARRLGDAYPGADVYMPKRFILPGEKKVKALGDDLASDTAGLFKKYKGLVFIMATGIVVRLIAPLLKDKRTDPAVVVMDEVGRHVISLLSGHAGGANRLAEEIAGFIGATPVITTASDTGGTLAVDTLADMLGCEIEDHEKAKRVTAAIVNGEPVSMYSHMDRDALLKRIKRVPENIRLFSSVKGVIRSRRSAAIIITPRVLDETDAERLGDAVILRPKSLVVGIGCNRGTKAGEIERLFLETFSRHALSPLSVRNIATIEEKRDEAGLIKFALKRNLNVEFISSARLKKAATPSGPSETVFRNMGVYGVCEPAALLSAGAEKLLVPKVKSKNATLAVAEAGLP
jgi:cobalt-precorrin 5A hydrolase